MSYRCCMIEQCVEEAFDLLELAVHRMRIAIHVTLELLELALCVNFGLSKHIGKLPVHTLQSAGHD